MKGPSPKCACSFSFIIFVLSSPMFMPYPSPDIFTRTRISTLERVRGARNLSAGASHLLHEVQEDRKILLDATHGLREHYSEVCARAHARLAVLHLYLVLTRQFLRVYLCVVRVYVCTDQVRDREHGEGSRCHFFPPVLHAFSQSSTPACVCPLSLCLCSLSVSVSSRLSVHEY